MGRRRTVVEGITLDLTDMSGETVISLPIEVLKEKAVPKAPDPPPSVEIITELLKTMENRCSDCNLIIFYGPKSWKDLKLCNKCHHARYIVLSKEIQPYLAEKGHVKCSFCHKERTDPYDFHLDHVNMYTKTGSVGPMMSIGAPIELIKAEIDKCQLLCISCHAAVTHFEREFGFIRAKKTKKKNPKKYDMERYDTYMEAVYAALRLRGGGGGADLGNS